MKLLFALLSASLPLADPDAVASTTLPQYAERLDLTYYLDSAGRRQPIRSAADWEIRRRHVMAGLQAVMGKLPGKEKRAPLDVRIVSETIVGNLVRRKLTFQSEPGDRVAAYLLSPKERKPQRPAVLCLHQTTNIGKDEPVGLSGKPSLHYALHLAERGYVTLTPDYPSFAEHPWDFAKHPEYQSGSMKAIWDSIRAIDLLETLPEVDARRIGCIGHSLGGHNAMFTAVFEPRIKVIVSSCGFCRFGKDDVPSWTGPRYMPLIATKYNNDVNRLPFDFTEIIAAFAPRPFLACAAVHDDDFDVTGVRETIAAATPIYKLLGKPDHLRAYYPDSPHDFPADARKVAYEFLDRHLKIR